jgi:DNA invertase Pin-like site-specific DNA recombinase
MENKRVALYARVSTLAGQSPEMQLVELREYAIRRGWDMAEEYVDHGWSGAKESRPALNRLMPMRGSAGSTLSRCGRLTVLGDH